MQWKQTTKMFQKSLGVPKKTGGANQWKFGMPCQPFWWRPENSQNTLVYPLGAKISSSTYTLNITSPWADHKSYNLKNPTAPEGLQRGGVKTKNMKRSYALHFCMNKIPKFIWYGPKWIILGHIELEQLTWKGGGGLLGADPSPTTALGKKKKT